MASSNDNILSWNPANWMTVVLMAAIGFTLLGWLTKLYKSQQSGS
jgi:hypothetical protein